MSTVFDGDSSGFLISAQTFEFFVFSPYKGLIVSNINCQQFCSKIAFIGKGMFEFIFNAAKKRLYIVPFYD